MGGIRMVDFEWEEDVFAVVLLGEISEDGE